MTGNRPYHYIKATGKQLLPRLLEAATAGRKPGEIPVTFSDPIEEAVWILIDRCWSFNPSDRPKMSKIRVNLEKAGLSRDNDNWNPAEAERERQRIRDGLGDNVPVDLKKVQEIFEELKQQQQ
jgi:hypothetical protein